jgi:hypothetical protein
MKRSILITILMIASVAMSGALYVYATDCGDTWATNGVDTFSAECRSTVNSEDITTPFSKTSHWIVYWVDGYERAVNISENGECKANLFTATACYPEFNTPHWSSNSNGLGE